MRIYRSRPSDNFAIIPNDTLRDPRLSYEARGILAELLSRPDDWHTTADELAEAARRQRGIQGEGRRKTRAAFAELEAAGYIRRVRARGPQGHVVTEIHLYDVPQTDDTTGGTSVPPAETKETAVRTDVPPRRYVGSGTGAHTGGTSGRSAKTDVSAGGTDVPLTDVPPVVSSIRSTDNEDCKNEEPLSGSKLRRALAAVVPGVTETETQFIREKIGRRPGVRSDVAVMFSEIDAGNGPALVADIRGDIRGATSTSVRTPAPLQYAALCGWCSRPGHDGDHCPDRPKPTASPVSTGAEVPCAAGEKCRQKRTPVPGGQDYHEICGTLQGLRVATQPRGTDRDEVGQHIAREQLAELQAARPSRDGGHAA
jgi:hypothetical protein